MRPSIPAARRHRSAFALLLAPILCALVFVAARGPIPARFPAAAAALGVASLAWLAAVRLAARGAGDVPTVVAGAIALRLLALAAEPALSDDVYRLVWEGELVCAGESPYARAPDDAGLAALRAARPDVHARVNNKDVSAAYPPLTQAAGALAVWLAHASGEPGSGAAFPARVLFALCDLALLVPLCALLRRNGLPPGLACVWGWSPLVALEFAGAGHFDSLGILLLLGSLALLPEGARGARRLAGLALLAGAILVKYLPLCALPFAARGRGGAGGWLARVLFVLLLCALGFAPLAWLEGGARGLAAGLAEYGLRWESTSLLYRFVQRPLEHLLARDGLDPRVLGRAIVLFSWVGWGVLLWLRRTPTAAATGAMIGAFLVLSPTLHPWYLTWMVPFVALQRPSPARAAWLWLFACAPLLYAPLARWQAEGVWEEPAWLWPAVALPFLALLLASRLGRRAT